MADDHAGRTSKARHAERFARLVFQHCEPRFPATRASLDGWFLLPHRPATGWPMLLTRATAGRFCSLLSTRSTNRPSRPERWDASLRLATATWRRCRLASQPTSPYSPPTALGPHSGRMGPYASRHRRHRTPGPLAGRGRFRPSYWTETVLSHIGTRPSPDTTSPDRSFAAVDELRGRRPDRCRATRLLVSVPTPNSGLSIPRSGSCRRLHSQCGMRDRRPARRYRRTAGAVARTAARRGPPASFRRVRRSPPRPRRGPTASTPRQAHRRPMSAGSTSASPGVSRRWSTTGSSRCSSASAKCGPNRGVQHRGKRASTRRPRPRYHPPVVHGHAGRFRPDHDAYTGHVSANQRRPRLYRNSRPTLGLVLHDERTGSQPRPDAVQGRVSRRSRGGRRERRARGLAVRPLHRSGRTRRPGRAHGSRPGTEDMPRRRAPRETPHRHRGDRRIAAVRPRLQPDFARGGERVRTFRRPLDVRRRNARQPRRRTHLRRDPARIVAATREHRQGRSGSGTLGSGRSRGVGLAQRDGDTDSAHDATIPVSLGREDWAFHVLAPVLDSGLAVIGDVTKFVTAGDARIEVSETSTGARLVVKGAGERITVTGWADVAPSSPDAMVAHDRSTGIWTLDIDVPDRGLVNVLVDA